MRHPPRSVAIFVLCFASVALADDFKTLDGKEYKNATVARVEPDGLMIRFSGGLVKIPFIELPQEVGKQFHYDPEAAAAARASEMAVIQQTNQQVQQYENQRKEVEQQKGLENQLSQLEQQEKDLRVQIGRASGAAGASPTNRGSDVNRLAKTAREEAMRPEQKAWPNTDNQPVYADARQAGMRSGYNDAQNSTTTGRRDRLQSPGKGNNPGSGQPPASQADIQILRSQLDDVGKEEKRIKQELAQRQSRQ